MKKKELREKLLKIVEDSFVSSKDNYGDEDEISVVDLERIIVDGIIHPADDLQDLFETNKLPETKSEVQ